MCIRKDGGVAYLRVLVTRCVHVIRRGRGGGDTCDPVIIVKDDGDLASGRKVDAWALSPLAYVITHSADHTHTQRRKIPHTCTKDEDSGSEGTTPRDCNAFPFSRHDEHDNIIITITALPRCKWRPFLSKPERSALQFLPKRHDLKCSRN